MSQTDLSKFNTHIIESLSSHVGGKSLVEPQVGPPFHRDQVAKPLVSQLMGNRVGDGVLIVNRRTDIIKQKSRFSETQNSENSAIDYRRSGQGK